MKISYIAFLGFVVLCGFVFGLIAPSGHGKKQEIEFDEEIFDFGTIERDSVVSHKFTFKNYLSRPIWIVSVINSCGCLASEFSKEVIEPAESGEVVVKLSAGQGASGRSENTEKKITVKFAPGGLERVVRIRALPIDDLIAESFDLTFNAEKEATNRIKIQRGFLSEADFKELSVAIRSQAKVVITSRGADFVEFFVNYRDRKFDPSDLVFLNYQKNKKNFVKQLAIIQDRVWAPDVTPLNYFKKLSSSIAVGDLEVTSLTKFAVSDGDKKIKVSKVLFEKIEAAKHFGCSIGQDSKNEFAIFLTSVPAGSITTEAVVELEELDTGIKKVFKLPVRVFVQDADF